MRVAQFILVGMSLLHPVSVSAFPDSFFASPSQTTVTPSEEDGSDGSFAQTVPNKVMRAVGGGVSRVVGRNPVRIPVVIDSGLGDPFRGSVRIEYDQNRMKWMSQTWREVSETQEEKSHRTVPRPIVGVHVPCNGGVECRGIDSVSSEELEAMIMESVGRDAADLTDKEVNQAMCYVDETTSPTGNPTTVRAVRRAQSATTSGRTSRPTTTSSSAPPHYKEEKMGKIAIDGPVPASAVPSALRRAVEGGFLSSESLEQPTALFYDMDAWDGTLRACDRAFGTGFLHAIAMKANAVASMLGRAQRLGYGVECASIGEVMHARSVGFSNENIVFDSPCKTVSELNFSLTEGIHVNIDNFQELSRAEELVSRGLRPAGDVGLRINPLVGSGKIAALSVSTDESKFGIAINRKHELLEAYKRNPWLNSVHVHVGSGGMGVETLVDGVKVAVDLADEINRTLGRDQVEVLDMGGGLPVDYENDDQPRVSFQMYADELRKSVPRLFSFRRVITEFGQSLNAKSGWLASRVEYTKPVAGDDTKQIAVVHFGADVCVRQSYTPDHPRRIELFDGDTFEPKQGDNALQHIAGPLCFQGDHVVKNLEAPKLEVGDFVVMRDAGANTLSLFSRHCSRAAPAVYGYRHNGDNDGVTEFVVLKDAETTESISQFWGRSREKSWGPLKVCGLDLAILGSQFGLFWYLYQGV